MASRQTQTCWSKRLTHILTRSRSPREYTPTLPDGSGRCRPAHRRANDHLSAPVRFLRVIDVGRSGADGGSRQDSPYYGGETPPTYDYGTPGTPAPVFPPGTVDPYGGSVPVQPYGGGTGDPWIGGGQVGPYANPYGAVDPSQLTFGLNGPQPYRFGFNTRHDLTYLPSQGTSSPDVGSLGVFAYDLEKAWVTPVAGNYVFTIAPQFNYRSWDGPRGTPGNAGLPPNAYRFGLGLKLATPQYGGWSAEFGITPAIATDFGSSLSSDGVMLDAMAVMYWRTSQQWMWVLGVAYLDRVDDLWIPLAGAVWNPNDIWEFRLLVPEARATAFLGTPFGIPTWAYATAGYRVESYQVDVQPSDTTTRVQMQDLRVLGGLRWQSSIVTTFAEAGWVFDRGVEFASAGTDFDVSSGFIGRVGFRY